MVGVRGILMDYVQPLALRLGLEVVAIILVAGYAAWTMQILWR